jgi:hypothetical protein
MPVELKSSKQLLAGLIFSSHHFIFVYILYGYYLLGITSSENVRDPIISFFLAHDPTSKINKALKTSRLLLIHFRF